MLGLLGPNSSAVIVPLVVNGLPPASSTRCQFCPPSFDRNSTFVPQTKMIRLFAGSTIGSVGSSFIIVIHGEPPERPFCPTCWWLAPPSTDLRSHAGSPF